LPRFRCSRTASACLFVIAYRCSARSFRGRIIDSASILPRKRPHHRYVSVAKRSRGSAPRPEYRFSAPTATFYGLRSLPAWRSRGSTMWGRSTSEGRTSCNQSHRWTVLAGVDRRPRSRVSTRVGHPTTRACAIRLTRQRSRRSSRSCAQRGMMPTGSDSVRSSSCCGARACGSCGARARGDRSRSGAWGDPGAPGQGRKRREGGIDRWDWEQLEPCIELRKTLPVGAFFCILRGATRGRRCGPASVPAQLHRTAAAAGVRDGLSAISSGTRTASRCPGRGSVACDPTPTRARRPRSHLRVSARNR